jgi:hypothetical protein
MLAAEERLHNAAAKLVTQERARSVGSAKELLDDPSNVCLTALRDELFHDTACEAVLRVSKEVAFEGSHHHMLVVWEATVNEFLDDMCAVLCMTHRLRCCNQLVDYR